MDSGEDLDTPSELKHDRFGGAPGVVWGAKKQCEVCTRPIVHSTADSLDANLFYHFR